MPSFTRSVLSPPPSPAQTGTRTRSLDAAAPSPTSGASDIKRAKTDKDADSGDHDKDHDRGHDHDNDDDKDDDEADGQSGDDNNKDDDGDRKVEHTAQRPTIVATRTWVRRDDIKTSGDLFRVMSCSLGAPSQNRVFQDAFDTSVRLTPLPVGGNASGTTAAYAIEFTNLIR